MDNTMRQLLIVRKDLPMFAGKQSAQISHASMAFLAMLIQNGRRYDCGDQYEIHFKIDKDTYDKWLGGIFTKVVCGAKNKNQLMKAVTIAEELGLEENKDFFIIKDACLTELEPEEFDENGVGRTITCIGFRPLEEEIMHKISKKYQLLK